MTVRVYSFGVCYCSVCAPADMSRGDVIAGANTAHPTGTDHPWVIADEKFRTGEDNPCKCEHADDRLHYLMVC